MVSEVGQFYSAEMGQFSTAINSSLVFPFTGKTFTMFFNTVSKLAVKCFFNEFEKYNTGKYLIIWDGAGFHQENDFINNKNLHFLKLPPYSPELNPAERLWVKYREYVSNKSYDTIDDLILDLEKANDYVKSNESEIKSMTLYHWIKNIVKFNEFWYKKFFVNR